MNEVEANFHNQKKMDDTDLVTSEHKTNLYKEHNSTMKENNTGKIVAKYEFVSVKENNTLACEVKKEIFN